MRLTPRPTQKILLAVTGGVAAYKACELTRLLIKSGREVRVVMTASAERFVGATTFQALSGHAVTTDAWDTGFKGAMPHIELSRWADLILVAPCTANRMAEFAHGIANDLLSTLVLARDVSTVPLIIAPAMNREMWANPATQRNLTSLLGDGVMVFGPDSGAQACGEVGDGRMWEPAQIMQALTSWAAPKVLSGKKIMLTAGPTEEAIDPVRVITNLSSGKMGYALAEACVAAGAVVTLVSGPTALATPLGAVRIDVRSAAEMLAAVHSQVADCDIFISVAAVADYTPAHPATQKIKKHTNAMTLDLTPTVDILASVSGMAKPPFCVGFAAESNDVIAYASAKRLKKNLPLIVANHAQSALGSDLNEVTLIDAKGEHPLPKASKSEVAAQIVAHIATVFKSRD